MLSKCANPSCMERFRYLHVGRIFKIELPPSSAEGSNSRLRRIEHFWLCEQCSHAFRLVVENGAVTTQALRRERPGGTSREKSERDVA